MKRSLFQQSVLQFAVAGVLFSQVSKADWLTFDGDEKPWSVNIGARVWVNELESNSFADTAVLTSSGTVVTTESDRSFQLISEGFEATPIPYASARYGRFHISGSYYAETDFDFQTRTQTREVDVQSGAVLATTDFQNESKGERSEWDISVGYYIFKYLALNVGYKNIDLDFRSSSRIDRTFSGQSDFVIGPEFNS